MFKIWQMKISKIHLKNFHQFEDILLDLTYPMGHDKAGEPLDKICLIGQSGTGKTTILELIPHFLFNYNTNLIRRSGRSSIMDIGTITFQFGTEDIYTVEAHFDKAEDSGSSRRSWVWGGQKLNGKPVKWETMLKNKNIWLSETSTKLIYYPANLDYNIEDTSTAELPDEKIIDFGQAKISSVWNLILGKIQSYQEQELLLRQEISKTVEQASNNLNTIKEALKKLEDWKSTEFNPIQDIADNCLDRLLKPFQLRVRSELDIKGKEDLGFIKIEDNNGNEIPHALWSTGTKQIVLSALPLYLLKPKHTVILFDEPERSLYPDLQKSLIDYYSSLTNNCQFFYSTHSPIIASNFEPWEIVELKFNDKGKIYREVYFEGENHVNNYKWNPKFMRWDDILQRIFDMESDGSNIRKQMLDKLATYNVKYKKLEKEGKHDSAAGKKLIKDIQDLSNKLSQWD